MQTNANCYCLFTMLVLLLFSIVSKHFSLPQTQKLNYGLQRNRKTIGASIIGQKQSTKRQTTYRVK